MNDISIVSMVAGWFMKALYVTALIMLGIYVADRGRKGAAAEQAEERGEKRVA